MKILLKYKKYILAVILGVGLFFLGRATKPVEIKEVFIAQDTKITDVSEKEKVSETKETKEDVDLTTKKRTLKSRKTVKVTRPDGTSIQIETETEKLAEDSAKKSTTEEKTDKKEEKEKKVVEIVEKIVYKEKTTKSVDLNSIDLNLNYHLVEQENWVKMPKNLGAQLQYCRRLTNNVWVCGNASTAKSVGVGVRLTF